jgi:hypothetical protein
MARPEIVDPRGATALALKGSRDFCVGEQALQLLRRCLALEGDREALEVVAAFPGQKGRECRPEVRRRLPPPELLGVDPVTAFDLAVLQGRQIPSVALIHR